MKTRPAWFPVLVVQLRLDNRAALERDGEVTRVDDRTRLARVLRNVAVTSDQAPPVDAQVAGATRKLLREDLAAFQSDEAARGAGQRRVGLVPSRVPNPQAVAVLLTANEVVADI